MYDLDTHRSMTDDPAQLRKRILDLAAQYFLESSPAGDFIPGVSPVPVSGKVIDGADVSAVVDSALDGWFTNRPIRGNLRTESGTVCRRPFRIAG